jgi:hypothetical protein
MARVATKTAIANLTASLLKVEAVTSIDPPDDDSKFAKLANRWYDDARRECLADHIWNFAIKRAQLASDSTSPDFGYSVRYELPADYIRVATIGDEDNPETDYKVEDGYILCGIEAPMDFRYIYDQEDILKFSPKFIQCFIRKLAALMAYDLTGNRTFANEMEMAYVEYLSTAMSIDGQESPPTHRIRRSRWKAVREGNGRMGSTYLGRVVT